MIPKVNDIRSTPDSKAHSILQERTSFHLETDELRSNSPLRGRNIKNKNTSLMDSRDIKVSAGVRTESGGKNPSQEGNREPVLTRIEVVLRDLLVKEKQACEMEPEVFSQVKDTDASQGADCCLSEEPVNKELCPNGETSTSCPTAKLNDQQSPMMSCRSDWAEKVSVAEKNHHTPQDICFTDVPDQQSFQHDAPDTRNELGDKENSGQQRLYVIDEPQRAALIMSEESAGLLDHPFLQTNSDEKQDQSSTMVDPSHSLKSDQPSRGSEVIDSQVPFPGECSHKEDAVPPHEPCSGVVSDEGQKGQKVESFIDETATSQPTDVQKPSCVQRGKPEVSDGGTSPSLCDDRCPTPTLDEEPYQYMPCSGPRSSAVITTSTVAGETPKPTSQKYPSQILTLLKGEMPLDKKYKALVKSNLKSHSAPRVLKRKDKSLSAQRHTDKCTQSEIASDKHGLQRGKPQAASPEKSKLPFPSACHSKECLPTFKPNTGKDAHQDAPQPGDELPSCSQSQIIPAKISKSDATQQQHPSEDWENENSNLQKSKTSTELNTSELLEKRMKNLKEEDKRGQSKDSQLCSEGLSNLNKTNSETTNPPPADRLNQMKREDALKLKRVVQIVGKEPGGFSERGHEHFSASLSGVDHREGDSSCWGLHGSLRCTIFNSSRKRSSTFLEQMSKRCLQEDLTEASVEEECLIFSEQMKQVLKSSNAQSVPIQEPAAHKSILKFTSGSEAAHSSSLQDSPSFVGLKITVNTSDRTSQADTSEEEIGHSGQPDGVSGVTVGRGRLYTGKMDNVGAVRKGPVRHTDVRMDSGDRKTDPRDHVKRERFHKIMNLETKRYSKTKYRFYILMTSDDPFFEETKVTTHPLVQTINPKLKPGNYF